MKKEQSSILTPNNDLIGVKIKQKNQTMSKPTVKTW